MAQERELPAAKRVALEIKKMWHCVKCGEDVEDHFDRCWNCQANRRGLRQFNHNHEMTNNDTGDIAAVTVLTGLQIDTTSRKTCPFGEDVLARGRSLVTDYEPKM